MPSSIDECLGQGGRGLRLLLDVELVLQGIQVSTDAFDRECGVPLGERLDDLAMLADAAISEARTLVGKREERRAADEMLHEAVELCVARELGKHLVEADRQALAGP